MVEALSVIIREHPCSAISVIKLFQRAFQAHDLIADPSNPPHYMNEFRSNSNTLRFLEVSEISEFNIRSCFVIPNTKLT